MRRVLLGLCFAFAAGCTGVQSGLGAGVAAPNFSAKATDGKTYTLKSATTTGGAFLYFIKIGCPVNHQAAPFFNKIAAAYGKKGNLIGVINGTVEDAKAWAKEYGAKFPILADPDLKIIQAYGADHSPWAVAVGNNGKIVKSWNSGSAATLTALNKMVATNAKSKPGPLSFAGAPSGGG